MRKILFRGKRIDGGEWEYGNCVFTENKVCLIYNQTHSIDLQGFTVEENSVGQYTGLTDKNGKKIFEWDIVKTKFGRICKVIFFQSPCYCGIDLIPLEDKHKCPDKFDLYLSDNLEVIGNIYDNPELLEVTE